MALSILDGNQSATTLSTILSSGQHITAHTVVSLGTQAITDIVNATSAGLTNTQLRASAVTIGGTVTANVFGYDSINGGQKQLRVDDEGSLYLSYDQVVSIAGTVTIGSALPAGTNRIGVVTIGNTSLTVNGTFFQTTQPVSLTTLPSLVAGTAQIGSVTVGNTVTISGTVTANPTGTQTIAGSVTLGASTSQIGSVTASISNSITIGFLPEISGNVGVLDVNAVLDGDGNVFGLDRDFPISGTVTLGAGTAQIGSVTASISNSVVTFYPLQGTAVSNTNFTSLTSSTTLVSAVAGREVLTVFNEGAGNLFISPGATATTISYQVRLSAGDYWECPAGQLSLAHTAVFATAGTARVTEIS
jgi:hypothetical protein